MTINLKEREVKNMSKEFEEIVLKKLNELGEMTKGNTVRLDNLEIMFKETTARLDNLETMFKENSVRLNNLEKITKDGLKRLNNLEFELKDTQEVVIAFSRNFAKFKHEFTQKVGTLFDAYSINGEHHSSYDRSISSLEGKVFNHDIRIENLEKRNFKVLKV